jgi:uncharacterized protein (DUF983 family)
MMEPMTNQPGLLEALFPFIILGIGFAVVAFKLATEKGRNPWLWAVLSLIPVVNLWCMTYFVGATNLKLDAKIDELLGKTKSD